MKARHVPDGLTWGLYLAKSNDAYIRDQDGNFLNIASEKEDAQKIKALIATAKSFGLENISVEWQEGAMQVDDEEYEQQIDAMKSGLILPQYDPGSLNW